MKACWFQVLVGCLVVIGTAATARADDYGTVSAGHTDELDAYIKPYGTVFADGQMSADVVGTAVIRVGGGDNVYTVVFYRDSSFSVGSTAYVAKTVKRGTYTLAAGKKTSDIVGIAGKGFRIYVWYRDGKVSYGHIGYDPSESGATPLFFDWPIPLGTTIYSYTTTLKNGEVMSPSSIIDMAIDDSTSRVYTYLADGTVISGTTSQLDRYQKPHPFKAAKKIGSILGMGIDGANHRVYTFYQ